MRKNISMALAVTRKLLFLLVLFQLCICQLYANPVYEKDLYFVKEANTTISSASYIRGMTIDSAGNKYITIKNEIRKISADGTVSVLAGNSDAGSKDGVGAAASFNSPQGIVVDGSGNIFVADHGSDKIRKITPTGVVSTIAGSGNLQNTAADGVGTAASFSYPTSIAIDGSGNLFVADSGNNKIRKITPDGVVSTIANVYLSSLDSIAVDKINGNIFLAGYFDYEIYKITPDGTVSTFVGSGKYGSDDGKGANASFIGVKDIKIDSRGNLYVSDDLAIRKITQDGSVTTIQDQRVIDYKENGYYEEGYHYFTNNIALDSTDTIYGTSYDKYIGKIIYHPKPVIASTPITTASKGSVYEYNITPFNPLYSYNVEYSFWLGELSLETNGSAKLHGTPSRGGYHDVDISIFDGLATAHQKFTLAVNSPSPDYFSFGSISDAAVSKEYVSSEELSGFTSLPISISGGYYRINGGAWTNQSGTVKENDKVDVNVTSDANYSKSKSATIFVGESSATFTVTTRSDSATPDKLTFLPIEDAFTSTEVSSNKITISGIASTTANIQIVGGYYRLNGGAWTNKNGSVKNGDTLEVNVTTSKNFSTITRAVVAVGSYYTQFLVTTMGSKSVFAHANTLVGGHDEGSQDGVGLEATFGWGLFGMAFGKDGNLFVADTANNKIRKITPDGTVTTFAGSDINGSTDGVGAAASFYAPSGLAIDKTSGIIYVADTKNNKIRKITPDGVVSSFAGSGVCGAEDGKGTKASFCDLEGIAIDARSGNLFVADSYTIRKIAPDGSVSTFAGSEYGYLDGEGQSAKFYSPKGIVVDSQGNLFVTDSNMIRKITPDGTVSTFAGSKDGYLDGEGLNAKFFWPNGITIDSSGNLYVADQFNDAVRKITADGNVTTVAGHKSYDFSRNGDGFNASFLSLYGIAVDELGNLYVGDTNHIRKIGFVKVAETPAPFSFDPVANAELSTDYVSTKTTINGLSSPAFISITGGEYCINASPCTNAPGAINNNDHVSVRLKSSPQPNTTISASLMIGEKTADFSVTTKTELFQPIVATVATVELTSGYFPVGMSSDGNGNTYIADEMNNKILKIAPDGTVTTFAGSGKFGSQDGQGTKASFFTPQGVVVDKATGNLYVADSSNKKIRKITPDGTVSSFTKAEFKWPSAITMDALGNLFVADASIIKKVASDGSITVFAGSQATSADSVSVDGSAATATFSGINGIVADSAGNLFVAEYANKIRKISPDGTVTTFAGSGSKGSQDGKGTVASFDGIKGIAIDSSNNIFVVDSGNKKIRKITPDGTVTTFAVLKDHSLWGAKIDGDIANATFYDPSSLVVDSVGNLYVFDTNDLHNYAYIRKIFINPPSLRLSPTNLTTDVNKTVNTTVSSNTGAIHAISLFRTGFYKDIATVVVNGNSVVVKGVSEGDTTILVWDNNSAAKAYVRVAAPAKNDADTGGSLGTMNAGQLNSLLENIINTSNSSDPIGNVTVNPDGSTIISLTPTTNSTGDFVSQNIIVSPTLETNMTIAIENSLTHKNEQINVFIPSGVTISKNAFGDILQTLQIKGGSKVEVVVTNTGVVTAKITTASGEVTTMTIAQGATVVVTEDGNLTQTFKPSAGGQVQIVANKDGQVNSAVTSASGKLSNIGIPAGATINPSKDGAIQSQMAVSGAKASVTSQPSGEMVAELNTTNGDTKSLSVPAGAQTAVGKDGTVAANIQQKTLEGDAKATLSLSSTGVSKASVTINPSSEASRSRAATPVTINYQAQPAFTGVALKLVTVDSAKTANSARAKVSSYLQASYNSRSDFGFVNSNSAQYIDSTKSVSLNITPVGLASFTENRYFTGAEDIALNSGEVNIDTTLGYSGLTRVIGLPFAQQMSANGVGELGLYSKASLSGGELATSISTAADGTLTANAELSTLANTRDISQRAKVTTKQVASYTARAEFSNVNLQVLYDEAVATTDITTEANGSQSVKTIRTYDSRSKNLRGVKVAGGKFQATYDSRSEFSFIADTEAVLQNSEPYSFNSYSLRTLQNIKIIPQGVATFEETQNFDGTRGIKLTGGAASFSSDNLTAAMVLNLLYPLPGVSGVCQSCNKNQSITVTLSKGWNLISNPVATSYDTTSLQLKQRGVSKIWFQNNGNWMADPDKIEPGMGIWAKFDGDADSSTLPLNFSGISYKPDFGLLPSGWSLVGTGLALSNLSSGLGVKQAYLYRGGAYVDPATNPQSYPIKAGEGFWVNKEIKVAVSNGWNLLSVPVTKESSPPNVFGDAEYLYAYRDGAYVQSPSSIKSGEGVWLKNSKVDRVVSFDGNSYAPNFDTVTADKWALLGTGTTIPLFGLSPFFKIWVYKNGGWFNAAEHNIAEIKAGEGAWVKRR